MRELEKELYYRFPLFLKKPVTVVKKLLLLLIINGFIATGSAQESYWQQQADYTIRVSLNDNDHTLDGFIKILYRNHSPDTLHYIWFHLWPNAFKSDRTAFSEQMLQNGHLSFYFSAPEQKGYINQLDFRVDEVRAELEDHPAHIDGILCLTCNKEAPTVIPEALM